MDGSRVTKGRAKALRRTMSLPEVLLWKAIRVGAVERLRFRRQHPIGPYVLDFYCEAAKLAVEVDGASHGAGDRPARDARRDAWLAGYRHATAAGLAHPARHGRRRAYDHRLSAARRLRRRSSLRPAPRTPTPSVSALRAEPPPPQPGFALGEDLE
jgi:very-short-patch-repair endonuclease